MSTYDHKGIVTQLYRFYTVHLSLTVDDAKEILESYREQVDAISIDDQIRVQRAISDNAQGCYGLFSSSQDLIDMTLRICNYHPAKRYLKDIIALDGHLRNHFVVEATVDAEAPNVVYTLPMHVHQLGRFYIKAGVKHIPDLERRILALKEMNMQKLKESDKILLEKWNDELF